MQNLAFLEKLIKKVMKISLLYRGSRDGWEAINFHQKCDYKPNTLSLFQIKNGDCIGGFTSASWSSPKSWEYKYDPSAVLFNLSTQTSFPCLVPSDAIWCRDDWGPGFGLDVLKPFNQFNRDDNCRSRISISSPIY